MAHHSSRWPIRSRWARCRPPILVTSSSTSRATRCGPRTACIGGWSTCSACSNTTDPEMRNSGPFGPTIAAPNARPCSHFWSWWPSAVAAIRECMSTTTRPTRRARCCVSPVDTASESSRSTTCCATIFWSISIPWYARAFVAAPTDTGSRHWSRCSSNPESVPVKSPPLSTRSTSTHAIALSGTTATPGPKKCLTPLPNTTGMTAPPRANSGIGYWYGPSSTASPICRHLLRPQANNRSRNPMRLGARWQISPETAPRPIGLRTRRRPP
ncbi:Uncharacterised protein [Mycobacteroides abscessus subsp. abscessus]|nr:Uncharacterised protein [Mycobacteroides abscessus subsp. abscessus]